MRLRAILLILTLLACLSLGERALPRAWAANQTAIIVNSGISQLTPPPPGSVSYNSWPLALNGPWRATESDEGEEATGSYTFTNWTFYIQTDPANGAGVQSWTFTVRKNAVDTAMTVTISEGTTSATFTGTLTVVAGDILTVSCTPANTPAACGLLNWYTQTTGGAQYLPLGVSGATTTTANTTKWLGNWGGGLSSDVVTENRPWPAAGTFRNLYFKSRDDPGGSAQSYTITLTTGADPGDADPSMSNSALTCAINTGSTSASDTIHTVHVTAGQFVQFTCVVSATAASTKLYGGYEFVPDVAGQCVQIGEDVGAVQNTDQWGWGTVAQKATEAAALTHLPACKVQAFYVYDHAGTSTYANLPSGQTVTQTIRQNGVNTSVVLAATGTATRKVTDLTHTLTIAANDTMSIERVTSATTGTVSAHYGWVYAVTQPASGVAGSLSLMGVGK